MDNIMKHILLIEDDLDDQEIFLSALGSLEVLIACETALSANEALERLRSGDISPDLIFLDLNLKGMHGFQFMNQVKLEPRLKKIPIIILSDSSDPLDIETAKIAGARKYITKPDQLEDLVNLIAESVRKFAS